METSSFINENDKDTWSWRSFIWKIKKYNGIGCFIKDFIKQAHQFGVLDERRTGKLRDRPKAFQSHSRKEWISLNGSVKNRMIEVNENSKRKRNDTKIFVTKKIQRKSLRQINWKIWIEKVSINNMEIVEDLSLRKRK